jgi:MmyB-like transcription regulator ligand binding domain
VGSRRIVGHRKELATTATGVAYVKHDVRLHIGGVKLHHGQVDAVELNYERLEVVFDTGLTTLTYTADPGTRSAEALTLLGSLASRPQPSSTSAP